MCRHIGYIGTNKLLSHILLEHNHSIIEMAYKPKEMNEAILNADGFGISWKKNLCVETYKSDLPIWNDMNLISLCKSIYSNLVISNVRSATIGKNIGYYNTHPFTYNSYFFSHNGYIKNFNDSIRNKLLKYLDLFFLNKIEGRTDSELIFYLILSCIKKTKNTKESIKQVCNIIRDNSNISMLNFLFAEFSNNGKIKLYATKMSYNINAPSLYYKKLNNQGYIVSSEKLDKNDWNKVKKNHLLEFTAKSIKIEKII